MLQARKSFARCNIRLARDHCISDEERGKNAIYEDCFFSSFFFLTAKFLCYVCEKKWWSKHEISGLPICWNVSISLRPFTVPLVTQIMTLTYDDICHFLTGPQPNGNVQRRKKWAENFEIIKHHSDKIWPYYYITIRNFPKLAQICINTTYLVVIIIVVQKWNLQKSASDAGVKIELRPVLAQFRANLSFPALNMLLSGL